MKNSQEKTLKTSRKITIETLIDNLSKIEKEELSPVKKLLIEKGLNEVDDQGKTPLMLAIEIEDNYYLTNQILITQGIDPFIQDYQGNSALHIACLKKNPNLVNKLIQIAAESDDEKKAEELVNMTNKNLQTPLIICAQQGNENITQILLDNFAHINHTDICHETAFYYALKGDKPSYQSSSSSSDDKVSKTNRNKICLLLIKKYGELIEEYLEKLAKSAEDIVVKKDIQSKLDQLEEDYRDMFFSCFREFSFSSNLLISFADYKIIKDFRKKEFDDPLILLAISSGKILRQSSNDDSLTDDETVYSVHNSYNFEIFLKLLKHLDPNFQDSNGKTALHHAIIHKSRAIIPMVLKGANLEIKDDDSKTPLDYASKELKSLIDKVLKSELDFYSFIDFDKKNKIDENFFDQKGIELVEDGLGKSLTTNHGTRRRFCKNDLRQVKDDNERMVKLEDLIATINAHKDEYCSWKFKSDVRDDEDFIDDIKKINFSKKMYDFYPLEYVLAQYSPNKTAQQSLPELFCSMEYEDSYRQKDFNIASMLIDITLDKENPYFWALTKCQYEDDILTMFDILLEKNNHNINATLRGFNLLHLVILQSKSFRVFEKILSNISEITINQTDQNSRTPLTIALQTCQIEIALALIEKGANIELAINGMKLDETKKTEEISKAKKFFTTKTNLIDVVPTSHWQMKQIQTTRTY